MGSGQSTRLRLESISKTSPLGSSTGERPDFFESPITPFERGLVSIAQHGDHIFACSVTIEKFVSRSCQSHEFDRYRVVVDRLEDIRSEALRIVDHSQSRFEPENEGNVGGLGRQLRALISVVPSQT